MKQKIKRSLKIAGYLLFLLVFLEISLQAFYYISSGSLLFKRTAVPIYRPDQYLGYSVKPGLSFHHATNEFDTYVYTNSQGFRSSQAHEEYPLSKEKFTYRILLLGPSFAFGWGVNYEDTFANQLKNSLEAQGFAMGQKIEVINAGVPAIVPANQLRWFDRYGRKYSPDLVIQFVYAGMAVGNEVDTEIEVNAQGYLVNKEDTFASKIQRQLKKSAVWYYGWVVGTRIASAVNGRSRDRQVLGAGRKLEEHTIFDLSDKDTRDSLDYYHHLKRSISDASAKLIIVHFPLSYCVHREDISRWGHLGVEDVGGQIAYNEQFCSYLTQQGIQCLNIPRILSERHSVTMKDYITGWTFTGLQKASASQHNQ